MSQRMVEVVGITSLVVVLLLAALLVLIGLFFLLRMWGFDSFSALLVLGFVGVVAACLCLKR